MPRIKKSSGNPAFDISIACKNALKQGKTYHTLTSFNGERLKFSETFKVWNFGKKKVRSSLGTVMVC